MNPEFLFDLFCDDLTEGLRPAFGSPGGKRLLASKIVSYFPEHKIFVESFVGGGAVFFKKKPSQEEIINDKDSEIAFAYRFIQGITEEKINQLKKKDWILRKKRWTEIKDSKEKSKDEVERYYRLLYCLRGSFSRGRSNYRPEMEGKSLQPDYSSYLNLKNRLKDCRIYNKDYSDIVKEFDSEKTFFYFDPPYPGEWQREKEEGVFDLEKFVDCLKKIKGDFICSMNRENRKFFEGNNWHFKNLPMIKSFNKNNRIEDVEFICANFSWKKNNNWFTESVLQEFHKEGYNPAKDTDSQLRDNWRLVLAKFANELEGTKTEFKDLEEVKKYARMILNELLKRGSSVATFHPENMTENSLNLLIELLKEKIKQRIYIASPESIQVGISEYVMPKEYILGQFQIVNDGNKSYGFLRLGIPKKNKDVYSYPITDFIPFENPIEDVAPKGTQTFWTGTTLHENTQDFMPERYQPQELQKLSDLELIERHAEIVRVWKERGARANDEMAINSHAFVAAELKRRGLEHRYNEDIDKLSTADFPVKPVDGKYTLEDALKFFNTDFYLKDPFLALTGGTVVSGEGHDWDIWVNWNNPYVEEHHCPYCERFLQQLRFRLQSQLPEELQSLIHLVPETEGKFTNYTPLARMKIEFIKPEERTLMRMSLSEQLEWEDFSETEKKLLSESSIAEYLDYFRKGLSEEELQTELMEQRINIAELLSVQEQKRPLEEYPKNYAILVNHFRGKSVHADFRRRQNGFLEGETIMNGPVGLITEPVETIEQGKKWSDILLEKGKFRPNMNPNKKVVIVPKATQDLGWLNVREVKFEPGEIGATKEHYGIFITMDEGMAYPGVQKPYFREFFLDMKNFKGRMVERVIGVGKEWEKPPAGQAVQWQTWMTDEQIPYLLTSRGRDRKEDVPPDGVSWLPPEWEEKVPVDMRWWKPGLSKEQKLDLMDKVYNSLIASGELKDKPLEIKEQVVTVQEKKSKFILRWHWWKGQEVVRDMPAVASHWDLVIDSGKEYLDEWNIWQDPVRTEKATTNRKITNLKSPMGDSVQGWLNFEGSIPAIDSKVEEVEVIKEISEGKYSVKKKNGDIVETKETYAKFKPGQIAYLDQFENLYTGKLGGAAYGNNNKLIPVYMQILDSGDAELIEDNSNFTSFKFNGKILDGYYVIKKESPASDIWVFSRSELPVKEEISIEKDRTIKVSNLVKPVDINFNGRGYTLIPTGSGRLRLDVKR